METLQIPATIEKVATRVDNTISINLSTQELPAEGATALFSLKGKLGWMLFSENKMDEVDVPKETAPEFKTDKSPSQRLRSVLYIYWNECTGKKKTFDLFYKEWMEKKIDEIKDTLPNN